MMKYLIIDDEQMAHEIIQEYCELLPNLELVKHCYDALDALESLRLFQVDLIFLDLNMPKMKGFPFLKTLSNPPKVIVTTAYQEFALEGYEHNIVDYLLKPFGFERFLKAVNKASISVSTHESVTCDTEHDDQIFLYSDKRHTQVSSAKILYLEAAGNYVKVVLQDRTLMVREKISELWKRLPDYGFIQVHKSFIVAKSHIDSIVGNQIIIDQRKVPIGKMYRTEIRKMIAN